MLLGVKSQGIIPSHNESCSSQKPSLQDPSWLRVVCAPKGRVPGKVRCGKRKQIIGLKKEKDPEELTYINGLTPSSLCSSSLRGHPHLFSLGVHLFLAYISTKQFLLLLFQLSSSPTCCCAMSLLINFVCAFTVSAASINAFFSEGKDSGKNNF